MVNDVPKRRSWSGWASSTGFVYWLGYQAVFFFVLGVCATEAIVETFLPHWDAVIWLRLAGGAALVVLACGFELRSGPVAKHRVSLFGAGLLLLAVARLVWCAVRP